MSRLDRKQGRFDPVYESVAMESAMRDFQAVYGQAIDYYRYSHDLTELHPVYDEPMGEGCVFHDPVTVPVLSVVRQEGRLDMTKGGAYWTDSIHVTASFRQMINAGLQRLDLEHGRYLRDRFLYDDRVWRITQIEVLGQVRARDVVVGIDATQLKPEDLAHDPQFAAWATREHSQITPSGPPFTGID